MEKFGGIVRCLVRSIRLRQPDPGGQPCALLLLQHRDSEHGYYHQAFEYLASATVMDREFETSCDTLTDVLVQEGSASGNRGIEWCQYEDGNGDCQSAVIRVSRSTISADTAPGSGFSKNMHKTARHEIGHTLGLNHDGTSWNEAAGSTWRDCMVTGRVPDSSAAAISYSREHIDWIADVY